MKFNLLQFLLTVILWRGAAVQSDGRIAATIGPSTAIDAGLHTNDVIVIVDGKKFTEEILSDNVHCLIIRRGKDLLPILNPKVKGH